MMQTLVSSLERSRAAMANDLAAVSTQNVELSEKVDTIPQLQTKLQVYTLTNPPSLGPTSSTHNDLTPGSFQRSCIK